MRLQHWGWGACVRPALRRDTASAALPPPPLAPGGDPPGPSCVAYASRVHRVAQCVLASGRCALGAAACAALPLCAVEVAYAPCLWALCGQVDLTQYAPIPLTPENFAGVWLAGPVPMYFLCMRCCVVAPHRACMRARPRVGVCKT